MAPQQGHVAQDIVTQTGLAVQHALSLAVSPIAGAMISIPFVNQELLVNVTLLLAQRVIRTYIPFVMTIHLRRHSQADLVNVGHLLALDPTKNALEHLERV